jgi:hypothetical protein
LTSATDSAEPVAEARDDAVMRWTLARLAEGCDVSTPPGHAAVSRSSLVAAGLDPLVTYLWIEERGGHEMVAYVRPRRTAELLGEPRRPLQPEPYFVVPLEALED